MPKLPDQVQDKIRLKHYSIRTKQAYVFRIKRFILSIPSPKFMLLLHEFCRFPRLGKSSRRLKTARHFCRANLKSAACIFAP
ncbi:MAG: hypothetical protein WCL71_12425, partial [Deltaproteobacteria bacterium]